MSNDGDTQMMPVVPEGGDPAAIIPMHTSEHQAGYIDPEPTPVPGTLRAARPAVPQPAVPFLGADSPPPGFQEFAEKWLAEHLPMVEHKAREYGSNSLQRKGERYMRAQGRTAEHPVQALEIACFQYIAEKLDRVEDAAIRGLPASTDTWTDIAVYALMANYIRATGRWL